MKTTIPPIGEASLNFLTYVNTLTIFSTRLRNDTPELPPVHIPIKEIETRFFPYPEYNRKQEMQSLVELGELKITEGIINGRKVYLYKCLRHRGFDVSMLSIPSIGYDSTTQFMRNCLKCVSISEVDPAQVYFNLFLKYNNTPLLDRFFKVDTFSGRIHTPITSLSRKYRPHLLINDSPVVSMDVATMQPLILSQVLKNYVGANEFTQWIESGMDVYTILAERTGLTSRDEGKTKFFEIAFGTPSNELAAIFGDSDWIRWINEYKTRRITGNPHNKQKPHSNLSWLLQSYEVKLMRLVWDKLAACGIKFLTVHDEIIVRIQDSPTAESLFKEVLSGIFPYFKLNTTGNQQPPQPAPTLAELETFFANAAIPTHPVKLDSVHTINDPRRFVDTHLELAQDKWQVPVYQPYIDRLIDFMNLLNN
jgi:hypothetical protein